MRATGIIGESSDEADSQTHASKWLQELPLKVNLPKQMTLGRGLLPLEPNMRNEWAARTHWDHPRRSARRATRNVLCGGMTYAGTRLQEATASRASSFIE